MSENKRQSFGILGTALSFVFVALLFYFLAKVIGGLVNDFAALPKEVSVPVGLAVVTILGSVFSLLIAKHLERKLLIEQEQRQQKLPVYQDFLKNLLNLFKNPKNPTGITSKDQISVFLWEFTEKIILWGSEDVIKKYLDFRSRSISMSKLSPEQKEEFRISSSETSVSMARLLLSIRRDLGHANKNLQEREVLKLISDDFEKFIEK